MVLTLTVEGLTGGRRQVQRVESSRSPGRRMAALCRLLECLLWPARKEEQAGKEEKAGRGVPDGPQSLPVVPRCAQRPHGGAAASWACASERARRRAGERAWRTRTALDTRYPGCPQAGFSSSSSTTTAGREPPTSALATCLTMCLRSWAQNPASPRVCAGRCAELF